MFKSVALLAVIAFTMVNAGVIGSHAIAKIGAVVNSVPSVVHSKAHVEIVAPVVRTVQVAPVIKTVPVVKTIAVAPVVKTVHVAPVVHTYAAPVVSHVSVVRTAPVVHVASSLKTSIW